MAWTEPGKNKKPETQNSPKQGVPPDLDKIVRDQWRKLSRLVGKKIDFRKLKPLTVGSAIGLLVVVVWGLSGIFMVAPAEQAVMLKFGRYQATLGPGLHWLPRFVESKVLVNVAKIQTYAYRALVPTHDQNLVGISMAVRYRVVDAENYLFKVANPDETVRQATISALHSVIGNSDVAEVLTSERNAISTTIAQQINKILDQDHTGISITDVVLQSVTLPDQVQAAFNDAIKSKQDEQHTIDQAKIYADKTMAAVQGQAAHTLADAAIYRQQVVLTAQTETAQYLAIIPAYRQAPEVTCKHLYLSAMETVLANTNKILIDGNNNSLSLSLTKDGLDFNATTVKNDRVVVPKPADQATTAKDGANNPGNPTTSSTTTTGQHTTAESLPRFAGFNPDGEVGQRGATP